eukprot:TRINITY_DN7861_c1_g1_i1.p1 TRINITY_DN7861_c1_g1~~TRINITY_DN7861_c1_g1_i1.p1  ORF type:complete len:512 (-),score=201.98 TRINITY_DN7861_c1_g1_i1:73-1557(-)
MAESGQKGGPKMNKASKKNKKSWRKNVDMTAVNQHLEEERFEERVGGSFAARSNDELFTIEKDAKAVPEKRNRKEVKKLRCFANLEGLPGAADPKPLRNFTLKPEDRENPIVTDMKLKKIQGGKIQKKFVEGKADRQKFKKMKEDTKAEAMTRRRTEFDFDLWGKSEEPKLPSAEWVKQIAITHAALGTGKFVPKFAKTRKITTGTNVGAVEVPDAGASYNPTVEDHQTLLWKAAMVEIEKEKELQRLERSTTGMFPSRKNAPTEKSYIKEMSEGIVELNADEKSTEVDGDESEDEEAEADAPEGVEEDGDAKKSGIKKSGILKPKTRRQKRDQRGRMFEEQKKARERDLKIKEIEISRLKSINKELKADEVQSVENEEKRKVALEKKMSGPLKLSNYNYEPQEIEIKLSDELTGNLRNLKQEGSLLEDRFKSMQRRNMIEVRVKQKTVKRLKKKTYEKRTYKMGWEENPNKVVKRIRQETKLRQKRKKQQQSS